MNTHEHGNAPSPAGGGAPPPPVHAHPGFKTLRLHACSCAVSALLTALALPAQGDALSYAQLVERLHRLDLLATPPAPGERSGCVSSFDRASAYIPATQTYTNWHANNDGSGYVRRDGEGIVAAELEGPGVIWRIWSADPKDGALRLFIDGAEKPALDMPFNRLFDPAKGLFPCRELVRDMARGRNCFIPIPYQKSCRVTLGKNWGRYYQITYTRFPDGWQVPSFTGTFSEKDNHALTEADARWSWRGPPVVWREAHTVDQRLTLPPGGAAETVADLRGPRAVTGITCHLHGTRSAAETERALRELTITIAWDDEAAPSVWSPLGDFFGSAPGINPFRSQPCGMTRDGMYAAWYMPFGSRAVIRTANDGPAARDLSFSVIHEPLPRPADTLLRFHAKWHRDHYGKNGVGRYASDRWPDWPLLLAGGGRGRFCGVALHIWNPLHAWDKDLAAKYRTPPPDACSAGARAWFEKNTRGYWWGEGDEKFFVDGEPFPSTFGTGSEDYFGYAWGTPHVFDSATQCQTRNVNNTGWLSVARWHLADNVPFQTAFEACIEKYHGNNWPLRYAATVYWYQAPGVADAYPAVPVAERVGYDALPEFD
jgi:hypothetical protein